MRRRYNLERSDNFMFASRVSTVVSGGSGTVKVYTGFPVTRASVAFATIPIPPGHSAGESSSSSSSEATDLGLPRIYVTTYEADGFNVAYENIPDYIGYVEFNYSAV